MQLVPPGDQLAAFFQILRPDGLGSPVRVGVAEAMDVVALLLQMLALEVGQLVDLIDIVEAAAPGLETEDAGESALGQR